MAQRSLRQLLRLAVQAADKGIKQKLDCSRIG
ncbi:MAG: hypothetical protein RLZZ459_1464 [Cyanobacteriota bacterium]|jgi:hypothetical protein